MKFSSPSEKRVILLQKKHYTELSGNYHESNSTEFVLSLIVNFVLVRLKQGGGFKSHSTMITHVLLLHLVFLNLLLQLDNRVSPTIGRSPGMWSGSGIWGCSARTTSVDIPFLHLRVRLHVNGPLLKVNIKVKVDNLHPIYAILK